MYDIGEQWVLPIFNAQRQVDSTHLLIAIMWCMATGNDFTFTLPKQSGLDKIQPIAIIVASSKVAWS
jgi:hypothetical protein